MYRKTLLLLGCLCAMWALSLAIDPRPHVALAGSPNDVDLTDAPVDMRVYQRNPQTNEAEVHIAGTVDKNAYNKIIVRVEREDAAWQTKEQNLDNGGSGNPTFSITFNIPAELANYDFTIVADDGSEDLIATAEDVVAGDIYLVNGQSNANANKRPGSGSANGNQSTFLRSFGTRQNDATATENDTDWHIAEGDAANGEGAIGQWALHMGKKIVDTHAIPVAIINGAVSSTKISQHQRDDGEPDDTDTIYGRLLWRAQQADVASEARAMLWYQGESDRDTQISGSPNSYEELFDALYTDWHTDYANLEKIYLFQIRNIGNTCGPDSPALRDLIRRLGDKYPDVDVMSTTGIDPQVNGCHFPYENGYSIIGENIFRLLQRDFYGVSGQQNIEAPNVASAYFSKPDQTEVTVVMRNAADTISFNGYTGPSEGPHLDFRLETSPPITATDGQVVDGNKIVLTFPPGGGSATGISYLGHSGVNPPNGDPPNPALDPRWGEWVTNANGVGLLAFYNVPLNPPPTVSITSPGAGTINQGTISVEADASDDGTVMQVEFFANGESIGTDNAGPPWTAEWAATPGSYSLTAIATDDDGTPATSAPVSIEINALPTATLDSPADGAVINLGSSVSIVASASDGDGSVTQVEFFANGASLGTDSDGAPWQLTWAPGGAGSYALTAQATDNNGAVSALSTAHTVRVNAPPSVTIVSPFNNSTFTQGAAILIEANPSDGDGTIAQVQFFANGSLIGSTSAAPWQFSWPNAPVGTQTLTAIAVDNDGATSNASAPIAVIINPAGETPTTTPTTPTPTPTDDVTPTPTATVSPNATLSIAGQSVGAPGSSFAVDGANFTPNATIRLFVNGIELDDVTTDASGSFTLILQTLPEAAPGVYRITVAGNDSLSVSYALDANAAIETAQGTGPTLEIPLFTYMPVIVQE